ncbi:PAS domain S-box protein [Natronoarchaeum rubrum]|uniref:PAS domain S-box protein n=1 Tax=Natronoarchaeum rubrum TaxID=755311 RepID=UPI0021137332|nr:PAS domain S-box protein [Natronoarchaeum rubrum]
MHGDDDPVADGLYRTIFQEADIGIAINDPENGTFGDVNPRYADMLGYDAEELRDMRIDAVSADNPSFDQAAAEERMQRVLDGEPQQFDWLFERKDGTEIWTEVSLRRTAVDGNSRLLAFVRDITESKERERDLEFFEEMVESTGVGIGVYRQDGGVEYANDAFAETLGTDSRVLTGAKIWEINRGIDREQFGEFWNSFEEGETRTREATYTHEGRDVPVETVTTRKELNGTLYDFGTIQDISERKHQEKRFQAFVEQSNDIITVLDAAGTYQYQSPSSKRILGYESDELLGESAFEFVHPDDRETVVEQFQRALGESEEPPAVEYRFRHADGSWRWVESRGFNRLGDSVVDGFVVNSRDVTDRKERERQIADLHDATRQMVQAADAAEICDIAVETAETVLDQPLVGVWLSEEGGERLEPVVATDDAEAQVEMGSIDAGDDSTLWRSYESEESIVTGGPDVESEPNDAAVHAHRRISVPLGEHGVLLIGSSESVGLDDSDIALAKLLGANAQTALERNEREQLLEHQTDQMEFFNSILRHDVLNAITVIKSRAQFLEAELDGEQLRDVETIVRWSDDVKEIVQRVRTVLETLTGGSGTQLERIDLGDELRAEVERARPTYPDVAFEMEIPTGIDVRANELLGDVLGNVLTNAVEHNDHDDLRVSATVERRDDGVVTRIADNGSGVDDDRKEAIFRRGETGHAKSVGSGFGLFFVDAMVTEYGGDVWVEDNDDGGATFVVRLPDPDRDGGE